jgi:hypothetical protein
MTNNIIYKQFNINSIICQYLIGVFVCLSMFFILNYSSSISHSNLQSPEGVNSNNVNAFSDFASYSNPAKNFISNGTFGAGNSPDNFRTIGYPAYLFLMMRIFGKYWLYATYLMNCLILPLIFPAVSYISNSLLGNLKVTRYLFLFQLITGTYTARTVWIGNDIFFFLFFILGIALLVRYFKSGKLAFFIAYLLLISYAAEIRPTLIWFPFVNIFLWIYFKNKLNKNISHFKFSVALSTLILAFTCNVPSIRNYLNYGFFQPSTVVSQDLFEILAGRIYESKGLNSLNDSLKRKVSSISLINEKMRLENDIAFQAVKKYPIVAVKIMGFENPINVMLDNGYLQILVYYGYKWKSNSITSQYKNRATYPYRSNQFISYFYYFLMLTYLMVYVLFLLFLRTIFLKRDFNTLFFLMVFFLFLLFPTFIIGDGGARFRITVEWMITMFAFYELDCLLLKIKQKKDIKSY